MKIERITTHCNKVKMYGVVKATTLILGVLPLTCAFVPSKVSTGPSEIQLAAVPNPDKMPKNGDGNMLEGMFTGGIFDKDPDTFSSAIKIASKINSVKDLGWTAPAKRSGAIRPRHRAWGGEGEKAIQDKANYDEDNEMCVEKWLTMVCFKVNLLSVKRKN